MKNTARKLTVVTTGWGLLFLVFVSMGCSLSPTESVGMAETAGVNRKFGGNLSIGGFKVEGNSTTEISTALAQLAPDAQALQIKLSHVRGMFASGIIDSEIATECVRKIYEIAPLQRTTENVLNDRAASETEKINALSKFNVALKTINNKIPELPKDGKKRTLVKDFDSARWETWTEGGAKLRFETYKSQISASIVNSTGIFNHGQIFQQGVNLRANQNYVMRMIVSSNRKAQLISKLHKPSPDWDSYQSPDKSQIDILEGLNTVEVGFVAMGTSSKARFTIYMGQLDQGTEITVHNCKLYALE